MQPADIFWKVLQIVGVIAGGLWFIAKSGSFVQLIQSKVKTLEEKMGLQKEQNERVLEKLDEMASVMAQYLVLKVEVEQLKKENSEIKRQYENIMIKLDTVFKKVGSIEIRLRDKQDRE